MKKDFQKKITKQATMASAYNGSRTCCMWWQAESGSSDKSASKIRQDQKLVFLFGLQQTYLDHSVRRFLTKQQKALDVESTVC